MGSGSVVGQMENEESLSGSFDKVSEDKNDMFGADSWEKAESALQKEAVALTLSKKTGAEAGDIRYLYAGDLLGQNIASSFGLVDYNIPLFGLYGACSTCGESLCLGSMSVAAGYAERVISLTSSHFASAQKEFRYPLEYGGQRPLYASWTVTGSAGFCCSTFMHQGSPCPARPSRTSTRGKYQNKVGITGGLQSGGLRISALKILLIWAVRWRRPRRGRLRESERFCSRKPQDYDAIFTGDLGSVGQQALFELLSQENIDISDRHYDCGLLIYDTEKQDVHAGGSGCGCSAVVLSAHILPKLAKGEWKRILFVPTGALLNKTSFNEGQNVPGIAHGVVIESLA